MSMSLLFLMISLLTLASFFASKVYAFLRVSLPPYKVIYLPLTILRSSFLQISNSFLPLLFNTLSKLFLWAG